MIDFYCHSAGKLPIGWVQNGRTCNQLLASIHEACAIDIEVTCPNCGALNHLHHNSGLVAIKKVREDSQ